MRFWDSSAIVPLLIDQPRSGDAAVLLERDEVMGVWWCTPVECWSALARLRREHVISMAGQGLAGQHLELLRKAWFEVLPSQEVRLQAQRLLRIHALRAGDALQLAAALVWSAREDGSEFVSFDARLQEAASLEGLAVV